jgi:uncharacterized membrane protein YraQ (UPF0718 family)
VFAFALHAIAVGALVASVRADREKTGASLRRALAAFDSVLPVLLAVTILANAALAFLRPDSIPWLIGPNSGWRGMAAAAAIGSLTLLPGFVVFPLAAALLQRGAGFPQVMVFVSTSTMVSLLTLPLEARTFGKNVALVRNALSLAFSVAVAAVLNVVLA